MINLGYVALHTDVAAITDATGNTKATYGYTAYGKDDTSNILVADRIEFSPSGVIGELYPGLATNPIRQRTDRNRPRRGRCAARPVASRGSSLVRRGVRWSWSMTRTRSSIMFPTVAGAAVPVCT